MADLQFIGEWEQDDGSWGMQGQLAYRFGDMSMNFDLSEPEMFTSTDYADFVEGRRDQLIFCDSHGGVSISREQDTFVFTVGKFGAGGDGELRVSVPQRVCRQAFADMIAVRKLHLSDE